MNYKEVQLPNNNGIYDLQDYTTSRRQKKNHPSATNTTHPPKVIVRNGKTANGSPMSGRNMATAGCAHG